MNGSSLDAEDINDNSSVADGGSSSQEPRLPLHGGGGKN